MLGTVAPDRAPAGHGNAARRVVALQAEAPPSRPTYSPQGIETLDDNGHPVLPDRVTSPNGAEYLSPPDFTRRAQVSAVFVEEGGQEYVGVTPVAGLEQGLC